ncbi:MAG: glycosyltransferase [Prevotella sp.]
MNRRVCVVIPTYNNGSSLAAVIGDVLCHIDDVIVVDDGSTDSTREVLKRFADRITLVAHDRNRGKGAALLTGFKEARKRGFTHAVTMDSDGQHYASDLPRFIEEIRHWPYSIIVGNRFDPSLFKGENSERMNGGSRFANKFSNFWFGLQTGISLQDTQTGFRAYPLDRLHWLSLVTSRYEAELELLVYAAWNGVDVRSIPVGVYYPPKEERVSHFRPVADFVRISVLNTILCFFAVVYALPRKILIMLATLLPLLLAFVLMLPIQLVVLLFFLSHKTGERERIRLHKMIQRLACFLIGHLPGVSTRIINHFDEDFSRPSVIICNHQSHLDLLCVMMLTPRLVIMTKRWVWRNPLYAVIIRYADFIPTSNDWNDNLERLGSIVERGYSVVVFPEGTRSASLKVQRFHQGAFHIASRFDMDIIPVYLHGTGLVLNKRATHLTRGEITIEIGKRVCISDKTLGSTMAEKARHFRRTYQQHYEEMCDYR